jgi:para-aminobenzoate synthetase / 4-amino-4-deoxychorismate lyase
MPILVFDFPDAGGRSRRTVFADPAREVVATAVEEVGAAVAEVEAAVAAGMYAAGYVAYEAAPAFEPRMRVRSGNRLPLLWFGLFHGPAPAEGVTFPEGGVAARGGGDGGGGAALPGAGWRADTDREHHDAAVAAVREAIAAGATYQVNLTTRLRARLDPAVTGSPMAVYEALRRAQGAGWPALLDLGQHVILSVSPELFFRTAGKRIETRPMKGTRSRGRWPEEDAALAAELAASEKDRAENLMIVDLLRNDLGRVCDTGSVRVPRLFRVERYRTVWQMTSSVEGHLRDVGLGDLLAALFPCGSVTGAPKISTMDLIAELETSPREVYCGAIGFVTPGGEMNFNVPIRTLLWDRETGEAEYGAGGGIVWDSTAEAEYDELLAKAVVVREPWPAFELVETLAAEGGTLLRLERHLARLRASAAYFGFPYPEAEVRQALADAARSADAEALRLRLTLGPDGGVAVDTAPLAPVGSDDPGLARGSAPLPVALAREPVRSTDRFLYHKTTHRAVYDAARTADPDAFDTLLWNERGEVTEFTRGNVVVELDGERLTPPVAAGLLPGCLRAELLETGVVREAAVRLEDLERATRVWFVNSARRWLEVSLSVTRSGRRTRSLR